MSEIVNIKGSAGNSAIPNGETISDGVSSTGDLAGSLSAAGAEIQQLQQAMQSQTALIEANTNALTASTSKTTAASAAEGIGKDILGGLLSTFSPITSIISGIEGLFGGGPSTPAPLPTYVPPASIALTGAVYPTAATPATAAASQPAPNAQQPAAGNSSQASNMTVNLTITAMDSQSIMDRSNDIASAVREAMLNMHPINNVVADL